MADLKTILIDNGLDYQGIMNRFMHNDKLYLNILFMLPSDDNLQKLKSAIEVQDYETAFNAAHTLKGVAGNLGLVYLEQTISSIVEPLRRGELCYDYLTLCQSVEMELTRVFILIEQLKEVM